MNIIQDTKIATGKRLLGGRKWKYVAAINREGSNAFGPIYEVEIVTYNTLGTVIDSWSRVVSANNPRAALDATWCRRD